MAAHPETATHGSMRSWDKAKTEGLSLSDIAARLCLVVQALVIAYIGRGHLFKEEGNLPELGFTFHPKWGREDSRERVLLLRHMCAVLGAAHLARAGAAVFAMLAGGWALVCGFIGELIFCSLSIYAYEKYPSGTGAKGSPLQGPVDLMTRLILLNSVGLILAVISTLRPKLKND